MKQSGRTAIVTGAASGLGRATAEALHQAGANLLMLDTRLERVAAVAAALSDRAVPYAADVRDSTQIEAAVELARKRFGTVHIAVNCAGVPSAMKILSQGTPHDFDLWEQVIAVNLTGTFNVLRFAAAQMATNTPDDQTGERGVIINTASGAAYEGQRGQAAYAASKAGVVGLSLPVARDLCDYRIRCVAIAPGLFDTEMQHELTEKARVALREGLLYPDRMGYPSEFASLVLHVIENPYINGTCLRLDGGTRLAGPARVRTSVTERRPA